jgi:hypothetical protein
MSHLTRGPILWMGIGSKAIADGYRHDNVCMTNRIEEVSA